MNTALFDFTEIEALATAATDNLIDNIRKIGFENNYNILLADRALHFKMYVQPHLINAGLISHDLRAWLDSFYQQGDGKKTKNKMNGFEKAFFDALYNASCSVPMFQTVGHKKTNIWIIGEAVPNLLDGVVCVGMETKTDVNNPDDPELRKCLMSVFGVLIASHIWLSHKQSNKLDGDAIIVS